MAGRKYRAEYYPSDTMEICQENIDGFFKFMYDRHQIWINRFKKKLPKEEWTQDPILKVTKYTNIYRELDRGTLWFLEKIKPFWDDKQIDLKILIWWTTLYRLCNRIETFEEVGLPNFEDYNDEILHNKFFLKLDAIGDRGLPVTTSAHLTCPTPAGYTKIEGYIAAVNDLHRKLKDGLTDSIRECKTSEDVFNNLRSVHCVGAFIAYEVLCDLIYCGAIGRKDFDKNEFIPFTLDDWANVGPGAKEGIRLTYPSTKGVKNIYARMVQLRDEQQQHMDRLGLKFEYYEKFTKGHLSLRTIEHSLCEESKYWLQCHNLGKQRMIFRQDSNRIIEKIEDGKLVKYRIIVNPDTGDSLKKVYL